MAKKMYVGAGGTAHKVKKLYAGSGGLARKVKRGYVGVGGLARPFFSGGELTYVGEYGTGSASRMYTAAASVGDYVLFGGGRSSSGPTSTVTAMSKKLVVTTPTSMGHAAAQLMGASVGGYALFAGGNEKYTGSPIYPKSGVSAYDANLTRTTQTTLSESRGRGVGLSMGEYALFGGGAKASALEPTGTIDAYNAMLVRTSPVIMVGRSSYAAAMVGGSALFAGGTSDGKSGSRAVNGFSSQLVSKLVDVLSQARAMLAGASVGKRYALFFGGTNTYSTSSVWAPLYNRLDAYDTTLVRCYMYDVTAATAVRNPVGGNLGEYGIFAGGVYFMSVEDGEGGSSTELGYNTKALAYDDSLIITKEIPGTLHTGSGGSAGAVDDYLVFGAARRYGTGNGELRVIGLI